MTPSSALRADKVFDGERVAERPTVLLDGDRVVAVGEPIPESVETEELPGATIVPGLVDIHQHLCFDGIGTLEEQVADLDDAALVERCRTAARRALAGGITTVRDLGDRGYVTLDLRTHADLPTLLCAGPPITRVGGHCWYLGGECEPDETSLRRAVRERAERGCDVVKVMATGGVGTPTFPAWESQFSTAELRNVVDEAHRAGLPVAAHCHGRDGIESALAARVDSIEHCSFVTDEGRSMPSDDLVERLATSGIALSASLGALPGATPPPIVAANLDVIVRTFSRLADLGAVVSIGSDAGISPGKPHDVLPTALSALVAYGQTPEYGLRAMTSVAARAIGLGDRKGRLAAGYDADLLAVRGDPLTEPEALTRPVGVWKSGVRVR